jgi:hypothetical protein
VPPPAGLAGYQPRLRYLLLEENRFSAGELAPMPSLAAALFKLEHSRWPEELQQVMARRVEGLRAPAQASVRRAFASWLWDVLPPARLPGVRIEAVLEPSEVQDMSKVPITITPCARAQARAARSSSTASRSGVWPCVMTCASPSPSPRRVMLVGTGKSATARDVAQRTAPGAEGSWPAPAAISRITACGTRTAEGSHSNQSSLAMRARMIKGEASMIQVSGTPQFLQHFIR